MKKRNRPHGQNDQYTPEFVSYEQLQEREYERLERGDLDSDSDYAGLGPTEDWPANRELDFNADPNYSLRESDDNDPGSSDKEGQEQVRGDGASSKGRVGSGGGESSPEAGTGGDRGQSYDS